MQQNFQVNLRGIIELLSNHLYSGPDVFIRELLQNAVDALTARTQHEGATTRPADRGVRVSLRHGDDLPELLIEDDGIGLTEAEVHQFLATLGESSKRGRPLGDDLIGQFGIGILACFLVSDEIVVRTRSAREKDATVIEWRGRQDGTYEVNARPDLNQPAGTTVSLRARADRLEWFAADRVRHLIAHYGALLAWPIHLDGERINAKPAPWRVRYESRADLDRAVLDYGRELFGVTFMDWIPLRASEGATDGIAFVLPFAPSLAEPRRHRVYLKGMLVSDRSTELVPPWAFFVQCVLDSARLRPTASRESLYEDERLEATREELGAGLRAWLMHLAESDRARLTALVAVHHRAIKALAADDDDILALFADHLPFETTAGMLAFSEIRAQSETLQYAETVDAFRQMAPVATAQGKVLVNAGHAFDVEVLTRAAALHELPCEALAATALTEQLDDLPPREQRQAEPFLATAREALKRFGCDVALKSFRPEQLPAFYASTPELMRKGDVERTREKAGGLWADVLGAVEASRPATSDRPLLCINHRSALVRRLASIEDQEAVGLAVALLYVHALLLGHHPLRALEQQILPQSILGFIRWGLDAQGGSGSLQ